MTMIMIVQVKNFSYAVFYEPLFEIARCSYLDLVIQNWVSIRVVQSVI